MRKDEKGSTPLVLLGSFGKLTYLFLGKSAFGNLWITNEFTATARYHGVQRESTTREWVNTTNKKETMSENRRNQLNSIGFVWSLKAGRPKQQPTS